MSRLRMKVGADMGEEARTGIAGLSKGEVKRVGRQVLDLLERKVCCDPPEPVVTGGAIQRELAIGKQELYMAIGQLMDYNRVGVIVEGKKRYYFLMEMVEAVRERTRS
jgi:hypothetical protein